MIECKGGFHLEARATPDGNVEVIYTDGDREISRALLDPNHALAFELRVKSARTEADARRVGP